MSKPKRVIKKLKPKEEDPRSLPYCHEVLSVFCNEEVAIQFFLTKVHSVLLRNALSAMKVVRNAGKVAKKTML